MDSVATDDLLLATLSLESEPEDTVALSTVVDTIGGSGQRLSRQVEVAVAVERLVKQGLIRREPTPDTELLSLTEEGQASATAIVDRQIELVDDDDHRELPLGEAADELGRSPVSIAAECSEDGIYYRQAQIETDDLVGRSEEQSKFEAVLDRIDQTGDGETVRVVGPGGSGKTTFVDAMVKSMPDTVEVCRTSSAPAETEPYQPIRDLVDQLGSGDVLETPAFDVDDAESYEAQQTGLFTDITARLTPESGSRVLVFDDINHADAGTWAYLGSLCQQLADRRLVVVLVHRPGTLPEHAPIHPSMDLVETSLELTGLDHDGTRQLIEQVFGRRGVPEVFVTAVHDRTGGAPLFVETTVETLRETNQVDPQLQVYPTDPDEFELPADTAGCNFVKRLATPEWRDS